MENKRQIMEQLEKTRRRHKAACAEPKEISKQKACIRDCLEMADWHLMFVNLVL